MEVNCSMAYLLLERQTKPVPIDATIAKRNYAIELLKDLSRNTEMKDLSNKRDVKEIMEILGEDFAPFVQ